MASPVQHHPSRAKDTPRDPYGETIEARVRILKRGRKGGNGPVVYWMNRDQRADDNWALVFARLRALEWKVPVVVVFCFQPALMGGSLRQDAFLLRGLRETAEALRAQGVAFHFLMGEPERLVPPFLAHSRAAALVMDFSPLRLHRTAQERICRCLEIPVFLVDAHNIVPCWLASPKREYAAYTFRPRIQRHLDAFLTPFPEWDPHPSPLDAPLPDWEGLIEGLGDRSVPEVSAPLPGSSAGRRLLDRFIQQSLSSYAYTRNDPNASGQSGLSPYLHFGQIAPQRVAWAVRSADADPVSVQAFLEELIVRRELSDNFCWYESDYDSIRSAPAWARQTLEDHRSDLREALYPEAVLEKAQTHDRLWNAAQRQLVLTGRMHGYLRMYWAKRILAWTPDPETAWRIAVAFNDRYALDGRDPNGYTGIAWSLGGVHDRPWPERPIFGKIRTMTEAGCRRKFDVEAFCRRYEEKTTG